ncbi:MAG: type II toxin-antitoxin system VapC family toxin [Chloroflexi bacterium]|nr:type II toxin-antitoxin system VapC family toxin [Chloroflexota bacterium]
MILYLDTSALIKRYILEDGSADVVGWMKDAELIGVSLVTRVEMVSALTRAIRGNRLPSDEGVEALDEFRAQWTDFQHINIDDALIVRADLLAVAYGLKGYDAVQLACALTWKDLLNVPVKFATYDVELYSAARKSGLDILP